MFLHISESTKVEILSRGHARCKSCKLEAEFVVYAESLKTTVMGTLSTTDLSYHMQCQQCGALFDISKQFRPEDKNTDVTFLIERCGNQEFPLYLKIMFGLWLISLPLPLVGLLFIWKTSSHKKYLTKRMVVIRRVLTWISVAMPIVWFGFAAILLASGR